MSNKRVLFICNSAYQLLTAVQIRKTIYREDSADLILTNQLADAEKVADQTQKAQVFDKVEYVQNKKQSYKNRITETIDDFRTIKKLHRRLGMYDSVCMSNISVFTILLTRFYQFKPLEINIFEDGFITYCKAFTKMDRASLIAKIINPKGILGMASHLFIYNPDLLEWHRESIEIVAIPKISQADTATIKTLNIIFNYQSQTDIYDRKFLFLEESFFADHFIVNDVEMVEELAKIVGKENVMVKLHPRNAENRFEKLGYKTNHNYAIPWELILLNTHIKDCTLISISSCAILQPYLLLGIPVNCISLLQLLTEKPGNMKGELGEYMQKLFDKYPKICYSPQNMEDFKVFLSQLNNTKENPASLHIAKCH